MGLGKTHLLHAAGHEMQRQGRRALLVSAEDFTNDLVSAIRSQSTSDLRDKYRRVEALLVDDLQFIAGKEATQKEFIHTFNALHNLGRQMIFSAEGPPDEMQGLEERLLSRLKWGLTLELKAPTLQTRQAIVHSKARERGVELEPEIALALARRVQSNVRELEGALTQVVGLAQLTGRPLTLALALEALQSYRLRPRQLTLTQIIQTVAAYYQLETAALIGPRRNKKVALARQVAMYLARAETKASLPQIGQALGGRDHTTVMHGCKRIASLQADSQELQRDLQALRASLHTSS